MTLSIILASIIFIITLIFIFSEKINRTIVALAGASVMVIAGKIFSFYSEEQAIFAIDFNTICLLLGMMTLVALLEPTGFFQYVAVWVGKMSKGRPIRLLILLGSVTTIVSMFLDNVTTVVLIAPVTILICEILGLNPIPFLISEALLSDTGGIATLVGDPPNILIASAADFTFNDFLIHSMPIIIIVWFAALGIIIWLFRADLSPRSINTDAIININPSEALKDKTTAKKVLAVIILAIILFLLEEQLHVRPALIAMGCASLALVWSKPDISETLKLVEWNILLFFASLFVMVGGMEEAGVFNILTDFIFQGLHLPELVFNVGLLWVVAVLSMVVDNVPITIALIPVIQQLGASGVIDPNPTWWALAFGAGLGGNGTIIGSTANIVVTSLSEKTRTPITPLLWSKRGLPVMVVTCIIASVLYIIVSLTFGWGG